MRQPMMWGVVAAAMAAVIASPAYRGAESSSAPAAQPTAVGVRQAPGPDPGGPPPVGVSDDWWSQVQENLKESEYEVTWQGTTPLPNGEAAWQAPNRAQGFRVMFTESGIQVVPRESEEPEWRFSLGLVGFGRSGRAWEVERAKPSPHAARVEYPRGAVQEWYENSARGLEQGFVLAGPPDEGPGRSAEAARVVGTREPGHGRGVEASHLVHLDLEMGGDLRPEVSEDGQAVDLMAGSGARVLRWAELRVEDGRGEAVPAWLEGYVDGARRGLRIVMDDSEATYPLKVDPVLTGPAWTAESNQASARFGFSVATAGDVNGDGYSDVIVGAPQYDAYWCVGMAWVFLGSATGLATTPDWSESCDDGIYPYTDDRFGQSVATAGDVNGDGYSDVIVSAVTHGSNETHRGQAYVYLGSATGLAHAPVWTAEGDQDGAYFGYVVASAGDVNGDGYSDVIVSAVLHDNGQTDEGRAYVYLGSTTGPATTAAWTAESNQASAWLGESVAGAGDVNGDGYSDVIVGVIYYDNGQTNEGRAYVYLGSATGLGTIPAWTAESNQADADLGYVVGTAGDVNGDGYADVIAGAPYYDNGQADEGRAYVYLGSAGGLGLTPAWAAESDQAGAWFGTAVATAGDVNGDGYSDVIVGAPLHDNGQSDEGRAFLYLGSAGGLALHRPGPRRATWEAPASATPWQPRET